MKRSEGKSLVEQKVEDFSRNKETYLHKSFNETEARDRFIDPLFRALGWEFDQTHLKRHLWDVHREYSQKEKSSTKKPDYAFRVDGKLKFFVEAKAPWVPLTDKKPVFQAKRYAFSTSGKAPIIVLTDFEEFRVFNAMERPVFDNPLQGLLKQFDLHYSNYTENWDLLYDHFSKEAVSDGSLDGLRKKLSKNTKPLDEEFLRDITEWREKLARNIAVRNFKLSVEEINESVQRVLDRLVFIRNLEDRQIEDEGLLLKIVETKVNIYSKLLPIFRRMNGEYNGLLFNKHFSEELIVDDKIIKTIIKKMCWPQSPFQFDVIEPEILGRIYEKFLGSKIRLTAGHHAKVEEKPEVRHAGGVYYTPQYIVDYIVKNTVGKKIEGKSPDEIQNIKIIDPACGSGSFLLGAFDLLMEYHRKWYGKNRNYRKFRNDYFETQDGEIQLTLRKKADILKDNIFGVDIDREATEVAMMSLYLKLLGEGFDKGQALLFLSKGSLGKGHILPDLSDNIKCGNSLIGSDFYGKQNLSLFENDELKRINAFDWQMEFHKVFDSPFEGGKEDDGGFDCVISNPPYIRIQEMKKWTSESVDYFSRNYDSAKSGNYDIYVVFVERGLSLLKQDGCLGFIMPQKFFQVKYGKALRSLLSLGKNVEKLVSFKNNQVFYKAFVNTCILILSKNPVDSFRYVEVPKIKKNESLQRALFQSKDSRLQCKYITRNPWVLKPEKVLSVLDKLTKIGYTLEDCTNRIFQGLKTSADKIYVMELIREKSTTYLANSAHLGKEIEIEKELCHKLIKGTEMRPYVPLQSNRIILFPYVLRNGKVELIDINNIEKHYRRTFEYLKLNERYLRSRERGKMNHRFWYAYGRTQALDVVQVPKIITPDLAPKSSFLIDDTGEYFFLGGAAGGYGIIPNNTINVLYLIGLLNSKAISFYITSSGQQMESGYYSFEARFIRSAPIQKVDRCNRQNWLIQNDIIKNVKQRINAQKRLEQVKTDHDKNLIQRKIDILNKQIDRLVYELYDLTEKDIRIIEKIVNK